MRLAVVPGDGIGVETTREALKVLGAMVTIAEGVTPPPARVNSLRSNSTLGRRRGPALGAGLFAEIFLFPWGADHFLRT
ncbi:MAG: hypothetical protein ACXWHE_17415, partial [Usitatibacter sp.]